MVSTWAGKAVLVSLFILSIVSWSVMYLKFQQVRKAERDGMDFLHEWRTRGKSLPPQSDPLAMDESPLRQIHFTACQVLEDSAITPATRQVQLEEAMDRTLANQVVRLENQISILGIAVSAAPFIGLLGTVWGVMDAFTGVALTGAATIGALAPGIAAALITTVVGLIVAIPSMIGYNILVATIRRLTMEMENFASEFISMARKDSKV